jgi:predicted RNA-binding Zn-ribbon protein involved in translation (DUF1610 family)
MGSRKHPAPPPRDHGRSFAHENPPPASAPPIGHRPEQPTKKPSGPPPDPPPTPSGRVHLGAHAGLPEISVSVRPPPAKPPKVVEPPVSRDFVFACPACGHPGAQTVESDVDIHAGASYTCDRCGAAVHFEALTRAEYLALAKALIAPRHPSAPPTTTSCSPPGCRRSG